MPKPEDTSTELETMPGALDALRKRVDDHILSVKDGFAAGELRMDNMAVDLAENTKATARIEGIAMENVAKTTRIESNTSEIVELFQSGKAFFTVLGSIGEFLLKVAELVAKVAKPVGYIAGAAAAVIGAYAAWKAGVGPTDIGPKP